MRRGSKTGSFYLEPVFFAMARGTITCIGFLPNGRERNPFCRIRDVVQSPFQTHLESLLLVLLQKKRAELIFQWIEHLELPDGKWDPQLARGGINMLSCKLLLPIINALRGSGSHCKFLTTDSTLSWAICFRGKIKQEWEVPFFWWLKVAQGGGFAGGRSIHMEASCLTLSAVIFPFA
eukprot:TRINITY_DN2365_c0_g1_i4.p1 TRINITY_DN2365_c0_g1~~TRINITY_DN2365_c0_g1_i4.p1  ORF type:complete len:178 (+),score=3.03 TRINITY_DN2365_c0_g1_i4:1723-2256(+)